MSSMFKAPKQAPAPPSVDPIPAPARTADEVQNLAAQQKARYTSSNGRASTLLTGGQGVSATSTFASAASLLGQVGR